MLPRSRSLRFPARCEEEATSTLLIVAIDEGQEPVKFSAKPFSQKRPLSFILEEKRRLFLANTRHERPASRE